MVQRSTRPVVWTARSGDLLRVVASSPLVGGVIVVVVLLWLGVPTAAAWLVTGLAVLLDLGAATRRRTSLLAMVTRRARPVGLWPGRSHEVAVVDGALLLVAGDAVSVVPLDEVRWWSPGRTDTRLRVAGVGEIVVPARAVPAVGSSPLDELRAPRRRDAVRLWPTVTLAVVVGLAVAAVVALDAERWRERNLAGIFRADDGRIVLGAPVPPTIASPAPGTPAAAVREAATVTIDGTPVRFGPYVAPQTVVVVVHGDDLDAAALQWVVSRWAADRPGEVSATPVLDGHPYWEVRGDPVVLALRGVGRVPDLRSLAIELLGSDLGGVTRVEFD